jgi:hypothetical protein
VALFAEKENKFLATPPVEERDVRRQYNQSNLPGDMVAMMLSDPSFMPNANQTVAAPLEVESHRGSPFFLESHCQNHNILEQCWEGPLPFQESRVVNRDNTHCLVISPLTQIELKSFPSIVGRYLLVFVDVAFYRKGSVLSYSRML